VGLFDSQRSAALRLFSGGRMFSSGLGMPSSEGTELSGTVLGCSDCPVGTEPLDRTEASREADDSGIGELGGADAAASRVAETEGRGTAGGSGSLARGEFTEVSPVNGFLYSVTGVMTSRAVGL
jgi:hypothetical protein